MNTDRSANAFFMSPPRAWEFLIGGIIAIPGFPVLRHALAQQIARGVALVLIAIPIFSLRQGPGFPGFNALTPCVGAALFIWSGIGVPTLKRGRIRRSMSQGSLGRFPIRCISGTGRCSPLRGSPKAAWCSTPATRSRCSR